MSALDNNKGDGVPKMRDSGLGSLGSESDTSPNQQGSTLTAAVNIPHPLSPSSSSLIAAADLITGAMKKTTNRKFAVTYVGFSLLDRRYTFPQFWKSFVPWLVAEVKRKPNPHNVVLQVHNVGNYTLNGYSEDMEKLLFEHKLQHLSKFSRIHRDTKCFVYLTKGKADEFVCHVYQAPNESMVVELFECIRDATKQAIADPTQTTVNVECSQEYARMTPASIFEIMYIGKMPVTAKKAAPTFIDETVDKFLKYEEKKQKEVVEQDRQRHTSGSSVSSLPAALDHTVSVKENELKDQMESKSVDSLDSNGSGSRGSREGHLGSSSENILNNNAGVRTDVSDGHEWGAGDGLHMRGAAETDNLQRMALYNQGKKNRTMLLQITANEVCLINTDRKKVIMKRNFRDISFCSQGITHPHHFGFITKELDSNAFLCYVFMCATEQVVKEVMQTLKQAFIAAYQHTTKNHTCEMCPMHQLHRLCEDIDKLEAETAYELILKRILQLSDEDQVSIMTSFQAEVVDTHQQMNEALISILRHLCEKKQEDHMHISDANKNLSPHHKQPDFILTGQGGKSKIVHKLGHMRNKARKSLTHSFESLKKDSNYSDSDNTPVSSPGLQKDAPVTLLSPTDSLGGRKRSCSESHADQKRAEMMMDGAGSLPPARPEMAPRRQMFNRATTGSSSVSPAATSSPMAVSSSSSHHHHHHTPSPPSTPHSDFSTSPSSSSFYQPAPHAPALTRARTTPRRRDSWRLNILNKVVTPSRHSFSLDQDDESADIFEQEKPKLGGEACKKLWKKAFLETLLLIRMQKEKKSANAHPEEDEEKVRAEKLDYEEMTPCLKEVTKVWEEMLSSPARQITKLPFSKINKAVRDGVPRMLRGDIWQLMAEQSRIHNNKHHTTDPTELSYAELNKLLTPNQHAILIDLGRTFPTHPHFKTSLGNGQLALFNLLKCYSLRDKEVGYCQGLSFVAGILLMHMPEEKAFDMLQFLMYDLHFRCQYKPDMQQLQIHLYQLHRLLHDKYRDLYDHFEMHDIAPAMYAAPWFLTLFASLYPLGFVARVFDLLFLQGIEVVFKVGLVLLGNHKELIKQCNSLETIMDFLKYTLPGMGIIQMERVINQAFELDISRNLHAYEVEYKVLQEEMQNTPKRSDLDVVDKLEEANHRLKQQNLDLLEKLQVSRSQTCSLDSQLHSYQNENEKLKSHVKTLELERYSLLNFVEKLKAQVPEEARVGLQIPDLKPNVTLTGSPIHNPAVNRFLEHTPEITLKSNSLTDLNKEVEQLMIRRKSSEEARRRSGEGNVMQGDVRLVVSATAAGAGAGAQRAHSAMN